MTYEEKVEKYRQRMHALQTGVAFLQEYETKSRNLPVCQGERQGDTSPKHLRVGINSAMVNDAALLELLIEKGIVTKEEHIDKLLVVIEREIQGYELSLTEIYGKAITLI